MPESAVAGLQRRDAYCGQEVDLVGHVQAAMHTPATVLCQLAD